MTTQGKVYLVGAGPGDPGLLTVEATRLLTVADVVFHDDLVSQEILKLIPDQVHVENVGKRCGQARITQNQIHSLMINAAREGWTVVRLKSGDPLVFGRAGEEMEALRRAGIEFQIIPGVTAAFAAAAQAAIPLTDRRLASKLVFLSNHECNGKLLFGWNGALSADTTACSPISRALWGMRARSSRAGTEQWEAEPVAPSLGVSTNAALCSFARSNRGKCIYTPSRLHAP